MTCDLARYFGDLARRIPTEPDGNSEFVFSRESVPPPMPELVTDRIVIKKTPRDYNSHYRVDFMQVFADKVTYRRLACWLLAKLFHPEPAQSTVRLVHPSTEIRTIVARFEYPALANPPSGYSTVPFAVRYFPAPFSKHPWLHDEIDVWDLPLFMLTNEEEATLTEADWAGRDKLIGFGSGDAFARLAELLLNAGCPWNEVLEMDLESEAGFRGVAPRSAEIRFVLPGVFSWGEPDEMPDIEPA